MVQTLHPGVYAIEVAAQPKITGAGTQTGAIVGVTQRGPNDKAILATSFTQFETIFGGGFKFDTGSAKILSYTAFAVEAFFKSGGTSIYVVRHTPSSAATASLRIYTTRRFNLFDGDWTDATRTIASGATLAPFTGYTWRDGDTFAATGGTGVVAGIYQIASKTDNDTIVLKAGNDINGGSGDITDDSVTGYVQSYLLDIDAKYPGRWYNDLSIQTEKVRSNFDGSSTPIPLSSGTAITEIKMDSVAGYEAGDVINLYDLQDTGVIENDRLNDNDGNNGRIQYVYEVDSANTKLLLGKAFKLNTSTVGEEIDAAKVVTSSRHRKSIVGFYDSTVVVNSSSTHVDVNKGLASSLVAGQHFLIMGSATGAVAASAGTNLAECDIIVSNVQTLSDRDRIIFANAPTFRGLATQISGTSASVRPPKIISQEFDLNVYENGVLLESHPFLSMSDSNDRDFIGSSATQGRLNGDVTNQSNYITVNAQQALTENELLDWPLTDQLDAMTGGLDGTSWPTAGTMTATSELEKFNPAQEMSMLICPDAVNNNASEASVKVDAKNLADYTSVTRPDVMSILDPPLIASKKSGGVPSPVQQIRTWRLGLPLDSNRSALYWPWFVVQNPFVSPSASTSPAAFSTGFGIPTIEMPPSGWVMGQYSLVAGAIGPHQSPANIPHKGVLDITFPVSEVDQDILNPIAVNAIRFFSGSGGGIRTFGARTLWSVTDGKHYVPVVRLLQFVEKSIVEGNRFAVFQPNDPSLWQRITVVNEAFLTGLWQQGMLFPSNDVTKAFFVKCDDETNPVEERAAGRVNCLIGINAPFPAEFVVFRVGLFDGGSSITELFSGSNAAGFFVS